MYTLATQREGIVTGSFNPQARAAGGEKGCKQDKFVPFQEASPVRRELHLVIEPPFLERKGFVSQAELGWQCKQ